MKKILLFIMTVLVTTFAAMADVTINSTNFPDATFRSYLLSEYPSGTITTAQLNARDSLDLYNFGISNMKGIEYFTQLTYLRLYRNYLTSIDVSHNTKLVYLNLGYNKLTSIDVTANTALQQLYLHRNSSLVSVSVTDHSALRTLWVNENPNLKDLYCRSNALTNFDVTGCTSLTELRCYYNANLTYINGLASCTALTYLDCEDCAITDLSAVNGMTNLKTLLCRNNNLTTFTINNKQQLTSLRLSGNKQLTNIKCNECSFLTMLDITNCTALTDLFCNNNLNLAEITGLNTCTALKNIFCYCCALTNLDIIYPLSNLEVLVCSSNKLKSFNINNKHQLRRLCVDDNALLSKVDFYGNSALQEIDFRGCTKLDTLNCYNNQSLTELIGLEDCSNLSQVYLSRCALTSLDLHGKTRLTKVICVANNLTSLNLQGCVSLNNIRCELNQITDNGMQTLVNSLPTLPASDPGFLVVRDDANNYEGNVITDAQAVIAYNKNWDVNATVPGGQYEPIVSLDKALNIDGGNIHFTTGGDYPWILGYDEEEGRLYARSSNSGVHSSSSTLTANISITTPNISVMTSFKARGESTSTIYDKCQFFVDGDMIYTFGGEWDTWMINTCPLSMGNHTLTWSYTKDSSVHPDGDYFAIDEVYLKIDTLIGDVNSDGEVNISDVTDLIDYLLGGGSSSFNTAAADCNHDNEINISDVTDLIDFLLSGTWH